MQDDGCKAGEVLEEGACRTAGVETCGAGFETDGDRGCVPILPPEPCPPGTMAIPGEITCREVAPCGPAPWGDIPVTSSTVYVDTEYGAADSDGSAAKPWATLGAALAAIAPGDLIAVAAGTYPEAIVVDSPVRIFGRCPGMVRLSGDGVAGATVIFGAGADGSELAGLAVSGVGHAVQVDGATGVSLHDLWIDAPGRRGVRLFEAAEATVEDSLIEGAHELGIAVFDSSATVERVVVRGTVNSEASMGYIPAGVMVRTTTDGTKRSDAVFRACLVERNAGAGVQVIAADALLESTAILDTQIGMTTAVDDGYGLSVVDEAEPGMSSHGVVRGSVVAGSHGYGVLSFGSSLTLESTVVRDTLPPAADARYGLGVHVQENPASGSPAELVMDSCLVEENYTTGVFAHRAAVTIRSTLVRGVRDNPEQPPFAGARGIEIQDSAAEVAASAVAGVEGTGIAILAGSARVDGVLVRDTTSAVDGRWGTGLSLVDSADVVVKSCSVHDSRMGGIAFFGSQASVESTLVRATAAQTVDGLFGDGVAVWSSSRKSSVGLFSSRIESSARAGISSFGSDVELGGVALECNAIALDGEPGTSPAAFEDRGGNECGCGGVTEVCKVLSASLAAPEPIEPGVVADPF